MVTKSHWEQMSVQQSITSLPLLCSDLAAACTTEVEHAGCSRQQDWCSQEHTRTPS